MDDRIKLDIMGLSSSQSEVGHFALILQEESGKRRLPIIIDGFQARAIALEIENIKPTRPMTHDLIVSIANTFDLKLEEVVITELKEGIFYAKLVFNKDGEIFEIDSRTSDAVAVGVRFKVPIYTFENVMKVAGIDVVETGEEDDEELLGESLEDEYLAEVKEEEEDDDEDDESLDTATRIAKLKNRMQDAISRENYEKAASLRDEISRLENEDSNN